MKKFIKYIPALTCILLVFALAGCGGETTLSVENITSDGNEVFKSKALNDYKNGIAPERYTGGNYEPSDKLSASMTDFQLQIYDDVYKFPMSFDDFMKYGWRLDATQSFDVKAERMSRVWFKNGELRLCFYVYNPDSVPRTYDACYVNGLTTYIEGTGTDSNIFLPGGYRLGGSDKTVFFDNCAQVTQRWDNTAGEVFAECKKGEKSPDKWMIKFNEQGILDAFELQCYDMPDDFSKTNVDDSGYTMEYKAPEKLGTDPRDGVFQIGSELYRIPVPLSAFLDNQWEMTEMAGESNFKVSSADETVPEEKKFSATLTKRRHTLQLAFKNPYNNACVAKNCVLSSFSGIAGGNQFEVVLSGNIKEGMTKEELIKVLNDNGINFTEETETSTYIKFLGTEEYGTKDVEFWIAVSDGKVSHISLSV